MSKRDNSALGFAAVTFLATVATLVALPSCRSDCHGNHNSHHPLPPPCRETYHPYHGHHSCETVTPCHADDSCHVHTTYHTHSIISSRLSHVFGKYCHAHSRCCD